MPVGAESHKTERGVRAGDEKIYRHVVENVQHILRRLVRNGVVGAGNRIEQNDRRAENASGCYLPPEIDAGMDRLPHQQRNHGGAQMGSDYVDDGIRDLFTGRRGSLPLGNHPVTSPERREPVPPERLQERLQERQGPP